jgi:Adenosyl cobinamide kinase/adenosyl cobinamide phosphate guanylyltransferase
MSNILLVTGGGRSGKSAYAESIINANGLPANDGVLYIATAARTDREMEERINHHRAKRPKDWITWERHSNFVAIESEFDKEKFGTILLDCVGNLLMGILFEEIPDPENFSGDDFRKIEQLVISEFYDLSAYANKYNKRLILVTNEVGMGIIPETRYSRYYRDALGRINKHIAKAADKVVLMVAGIPMELK